jgi:putative membrane protein
MFVDWLLASFHHLAVFSLAAILSAEIFLTAGPIDDRMALRLARVDAWYGILAALVIAAGVLRVFFGAKGFAYYLVNIFFWAKMALFVGIALLSVAPTYSYLAWRRRVRADSSYRPPSDEIAQLRRVLYVEAGAVRPDPDLRRGDGAGLWDVTNYAGFG